MGIGCDYESYGSYDSYLYINDEHAANNLGDFLKDNKLEDCFVMSGNPELVQIVRKKARMPREQ